MNILIFSIFDIHAAGNSKRMLAFARHWKDDKIIYIVAKSNLNEIYSDQFSHITFVEHDWHISKFHILLKILANVRDTDVLVACKAFSVTGLFGLLLSWITRKRFVLDADDLESAGIQNKFMHEKLVEYFLRKVARNVVVSSYHLQRYWPDSKYIPHAPDINEWKRDDFNQLDVLQKYQETLSVDLTDTLLFVWPGQFSGNVDKGDIFQFFFEVKRLGQRFILVLFGIGDYVPLYKEIVRNLSLDNNVVFLGRISDREVKELYSIASFGVVPLRKHKYDECKMPIKLLEIMSMSVPVLSTNIGEPKYCVEKANCGFLIDFDERFELSAKRFVSFVKKGDLGRIGSNGREFVKQHRDIYSLSMQYRAILSGESKTDELTE